MPFAYPSSVRDTIVARLAAGERLEHICAQAGMPSADSVRGWVRGDAALAARVALARAQGGERRRFGFDEAVARVLIGRLAAGERIEAVLGDPAMPSRAAYRYWLATQGWFAEAVEHTLAAKRAARRGRLAGRLRAFDPAVAERLYVRLWKGGATLRAVLASDAAFPSRTVLARWRREQPRFDAMLRFVLDGWRTKRGRPGRGRWSPELEEQVLAWIVEGGSLRGLAERPGMPCARTLYAWCRTRPDFAAAVARACEDREDWYRDQILEIAEAARPGGVTAARKAMAPLNAQLVRLKKRPGWKARKGKAG